MKRKPNNQKHRRSRRSLGQKLTLFVWVLSAFMLLALVVNYLQLEKLKNQLERQNIKISELKKTKDSMSGKLDGIKNSDEIASLARYKLGMVYPEDKQVVFINVEPQEAETDVKDNVFLSPVISILKIFGTNDKEGTS